jgi:hypothetical protein
VVIAAKTPAEAVKRAGVRDSIRAIDLVTIAPDGKIVR